MRQEKINEIKSMIPFIKNLMPEEASIGIWDRNGTLLYFEKSEAVNVNLQQGFVLEDKNDSLFVCMQTGKTTNTSYPKEVFGTYIEGKAVPVYDENKVVGCISCLFSSENIKTMKKNLSDVTSFMKVLESKVNDVSNIVNTIKTNSSRTNMLALNASIEAARAGESGRGFSIVASELGKLSQLSTDATTDISKTLAELVKSMSDVLKALSEFDSNK